MIHVTNDYRCVTIEPESEGWHTYHLELVLPNSAIVDPRPSGLRIDLHTNDPNIAAVVKPGAVVSLSVSAIYPQKDVR